MYNMDAPRALLMGDMQLYTWTGRGGVGLGGGLGAGGGGLGGGKLTSSTRSAPVALARAVRSGRGGLVGGRGGEGGGGEGDGGEGGGGLGDGGEGGGLGGCNVPACRHSMNTHLSVHRSYHHYLTV